MSKYDSDSEENLFQPGSNDTVLANRLRISEADEMDEVERILLVKLYKKLFMGNDVADSICFQDVLGWHRQWLGNVYSWAGKLRTSNIGKDGFQFASPLRFEQLIGEFEQSYLRVFPSLSTFSDEELVQHIARSHVEFILIHPVRDGNGRLSRLLIDMMAYQAGLGLQDYSLWDENKVFYFRSIQAGVGGDYQHICTLVRDILFD